MKRNRVNYNELTVICSGEPSKEVLKNYYNLLIDYQIQVYGKEVVKKALEQVINEQ